MMVQVVQRTLQHVLVVEKVVRRLVRVDLVLMVSLVVVVVTLGELLAEEGRADERGHVEGGRGGTGLVVEEEVGGAERAVR
jgi:hypothetical protein